ncbi:hypothetical protein B9Q04_10105 [Candidatus Marsarchaeota G2 archaeon BE_D]|jgi:hypothetical protein|uniref:Uncharacterized protein n=4 Tax=Candidatus Marsarchaeota group 2 TaxID=2203771 RepID=A0A2R6C9V0_9ARCH|nr:MAG: hypothetical protein B9Q06_02145 [Candidatus Marsarchaeota G2 archaeon ECH_B_2]PSO01123.1 MAG: hypothetical protein B9Q07_01490 [Candidatus Marsarchaeota G2 archaeon ECH_B_3]PSO02992.1 MAG: hypothetical protein B9Q05_02775 [Candidatus Marsarchaeota G2 archaeon ECH_B_1]PSO07590.1 MAG: hypothetical protein B9Q04_10105 [Candidatus Marsarchaeota G2 archaeon BE_D]
MNTDPVLVDGTKKNCRGIVAQLVDIMSQVGVGAVVDAVVPDAVNREEVINWAKRRGYTIVADTRRGNVFVLSLMKTH